MKEILREKNDVLKSFENSHLAKKIVGAVQCQILKSTAKTKTSNLGGEHSLQIIAKTGYPPNSRLRPDSRFSTKETGNQRIGEVAKQYENN